MKKALLLALLFSTSVRAEQDGHKHSLSAHEHGLVNLAFAFEGKTLDIELQGPSESFFGFEHKPTSKDDVLAFNRAKDLWTKEILSKLIMFDGKLNCKIDSTSFVQEFEEKLKTHSSIDAEAKITCEGTPFKGNDVKIGLKDKFPKIKKLKLEIIDADKTKAIDLKKAIEIIKL